MDDWLARLIVGARFPLLLALLREAVIIERLSLSESPFANIILKQPRLFRYPARESMGLNVQQTLCFIYTYVGGINVVTRVRGHNVDAGLRIKDGYPTTRNRRATNDHSQTVWKRQSGIPFPRAGCYFRVQRTRDTGSRLIPSDQRRLPIRPNASRPPCDGENQTESKRYG